MAGGKFILWRDWLQAPWAGSCFAMTSDSRQQGSPPAGTSSRWLRADGQLPLVGRFFPAPVAVKVPEIIFLFWVVKILTTAGGEVTSDYLKKYGNIGGGGTEVALFVIALALQFGTRRYRALAYWSLAYAIAIAGTGLSDFLHLDVHIPYAGTGSRARSRSTASPPSAVRRSTGRPCSQPLRSVPRWATSPPPP
jgi:hypothetical protein